MVEVAIFNVQRAITPETRNPMLWYMCSACCPMMLYICVKFHENISNAIRIREQTKMSKALMDRQMVRQRTSITKIFRSNLSIIHTRSLQKVPSTLLPS